MKKPNPKNYVGRAMEYYRAGAEYNKAQSGKEMGDYQFKLSEITPDNFAKTLGISKSEASQESGQGFMRQLRRLQNQYLSAKAASENAKAKKKN